MPDRLAAIPAEYRAREWKPNRGEWVFPRPRRIFRGDRLSTGAPAPAPGRRGDGCVGDARGGIIAPQLASTKAAKRGEFGKFTHNEVEFTSKTKLKLHYMKPIAFYNSGVQRWAGASGRAILHPLGQTDSSRLTPSPSSSGLCREVPYAARKCKSSGDALSPRKVLALTLLHSLASILESLNETGGRTVGKLSHWPRG